MRLRPRGMALAAGDSGGSCRVEALGAMAQRQDLLFLPWSTQDTETSGPVLEHGQKKASHLQSWAGQVRAGQGRAGQAGQGRKEPQGLWEVKMEEKGKRKGTQPAQPHLCLRVNY